MTESDALRLHLKSLMEQADVELLGRYVLRPQSFAGRVLQRVVRFLEIVHLRPPFHDRFWDAGLKHAQALVGARPLLIWGLDVEPEVLRQACADFSQHLMGRPELAPVLLTSVADFAFFSRLGWLVEYLPDLSGEGERYRERKLHYLAWRYQGALVVPLTAGMSSPAEWENLCG